MSYTKHNYKKGDELLASQLNEMDDQIELNEQTADILVTVSNTQPSQEKNRVWVKATPSEIEIPTMDDIDEVNRHLSDLEDTVSTTQIINTASGAIASFSDGANGMPVRKLISNIEPVQDLHGYANPWPAGSGTNIIPTGTDTSNGYIEGRTINASGSVDTVTSGYDVSEYFGITAGETYSLCIYPAVLGTNIGFAFYDANKQYLSGADLGADATGICTLTADSGAVYCRATKNRDGNTYQTLFCRGSTRPISWTPYENRCPISGYTGLAVTRTGANVWDEEWELGDLNTNTGGNYPASDRIRSKNYIPCKQNGSYYFKSPNNAIVCFYGKDKSFLAPNIIVLSNSVFTKPQNAYYMRLAVNPSYGTVYKNDISVNYPATVTTYHPYTGNQISVNWEDEAGTVYGGTLTLNSDGTVDLANSYKYFIAPLEGAPMYTNDNVNFFWYTDWNNPRNKCKPQGNVVCSIYPSGRGNGNVWLGWPGNYGNCLVIQDNSVSTVEEMLAKIDGAEFAYELDTPVTYHLDNVGQLYTFLGTNNIWSSTGDTEVTYLADTKLYIDGKLAEIQATILENIGG